MPTHPFPKFRGILLTWIACSVVVPAATAENWTRFRGENGTGVSGQKGLPATWSKGDYEWDVELPGIGHSSPVIWGERLFVTSAVAEGTVRYLHCLNAVTGEVHWSRMVGNNPSSKHLKSSWASSTPATDGERVYVAFADKERFSLTAWDHAGQLVWRRNLGPYPGRHGLGVSPITFDGMVILANDQTGPSSIIALNAETGSTVWSTLRGFRETSYATPIIYQPAGQKPQLICVNGATGVSSLDPYTGEPRWATGELPLRTVASPVAGGGLIIASCGNAGQGKLLVAVEADAGKPAGESRIKYERERILPYVPTPVVHKDHLYLWGDSGVVNCVEIATGKNIWTERIGGKYSGSPVLIDGKIYVMSEEGKCVVIAASPQFQKLGENDLGEPSHATPAVAGGRLYLRTFHRLAALKAEE